MLYYFNVYSYKSDFQTQTTLEPMPHAIHTHHVTDFYFLLDHEPYPYALPSGCAHVYTGFNVATLNQPTANLQRSQAMNSTFPECHNLSHREFGNRPCG